ncbi:MAG: aminoglycoside phosphotransferase family protein [Anaerolineae bacterium]|nr:aminoglycoside phosphotransferase family protein [Anaerolineae bacterium]MDQ7033654.1 aminoglycoside phosphotransferase family protein [Anaerolineae bacterium]
MNTKTDFIAAQVLGYLKKHADYDSSLTIDTINVLEKPWSIIYFMTLTERGKIHKIVIKVSRFPDQQRAEESWQEDHLIDRGVREYDSLVRIYDYFQSQANDMLRAVRPITFIRDINGIVMDFIDGDSFYQTCMKPKRILAPNGKERAQKLAYRSGEWLRTFHDLSLSMPETTTELDRLYSPTHAKKWLLEAVERLQKRGVDPTQWAIWSDIESALKSLDSDVHVWIHSDFHMGNTMVLPEERILGFDTALDKQDHPYTDVGKFLADIQSRAAHTMSLQLIPSVATVEKLRQQFLDGYLQGRAVNQPLLALYEGQYLFEKWDESLEALETRLPTKVPRVAQHLLGNSVLNPTFKRIIHRWAERDLLR